MIVFSLFLNNDIEFLWTLFSAKIKLMRQRAVKYQLLIIFNALLMMKVSTPRTGVTVSAYIFLRTGVTVSLPIYSSRSYSSNNSRYVFGLGCLCFCVEYNSLDILIIVFVLSFSRRYKWKRSS